jgi:predicted porin
LGGDCCADLEERVADLEATTARKGNRKVKLEVSGTVNEALMWWDDGQESNIYQGTNDTARSRFRFKGEAKITSDVKAGYLIELGLRTNRLNRTDQDLSSASPGGPDIRHSVWYLESKTYGRGSVGMTSQATDGATEATTANMNHFARPSLSKWNGNFDVIVNGERETGAEWRDFLAQSGFTGDNVPGEGDRRNLIRYDSPEFAGFVASASWGEDDFWDVGLKYKGEHHGFKFAAAAGYAAYSDGNVRNSGQLGTVPESISNLRGCSRLPFIPGGFPAPQSNGDVDCNEFGISGSAMHVETGLFVTGAYGIRRDDLRKTAFGFDVDDDDDFWSVQAGIERKFIEHGKTTLYGEYWQANTGAGISGRGSISTYSFNGLPGSLRQASSDISYWGVGVNQHFEKASLDLYLAYRRHQGDVDLSITGTDVGAVNAEFDALDIVMSGAMIKF